MRYLDIVGKYWTKKFTRIMARAKEVLYNRLQGNKLCEGRINRWIQNIFEKGLSSILVYIRLHCSQPLILSVTLMKKSLLNFNDIIKFLLKTPNSCYPIICFLFFLWPHNMFIITKRLFWKLIKKISKGSRHISMQNIFFMPVFQFDKNIFLNISDL